MGKLVELFKLLNYKIISIIVVGILIALGIAAYFSPEGFTSILEAIAKCIGG